MWRCYPVHRDSGILQSFLIVCCAVAGKCGECRSMYSRRLYQIKLAIARGVYSSGCITIVVWVTAYPLCERLQQFKCPIRCACGRLDIHATHPLSSSSVDGLSAQLQSDVHRRLKGVPMRLRLLQGVLVLSGDTGNERRELAALSRLLREQGYQHGGMIIGAQAIQVSVPVAKKPVAKSQRWGVQRVRSRKKIGGVD